MPYTHNTYMQCNIHIYMNTATKSVRHHRAALRDYVQFGAPINTSRIESAWHIHRVRLRGYVQLNTYIQE